MEEAQPTKAATTDDDSAAPAPAESTTTTTEETNSSSSSSAAASAGPAAAMPTPLQIPPAAPASASAPAPMPTATTATTTPNPSPRPPARSPAAEELIGDTLKCPICLEWFTVCVLSTSIWSHRSTGRWFVNRHASSPQGNPAGADDQNGVVCVSPPLNERYPHPPRPYVYV